MKQNQNRFQSEIVYLQDDQFLQNMMVAGRVVGDTLTLLENLVKEKTNLSLIELNQMAEDYIYSQNCYPTFKNYKSSHSKIAFPTGVCISVDNDDCHTLVHGIPTSYKLMEHDLVSFDLGATYTNNGKEYIADSALTTIWGEPKNQQHLDLVDTTEKCLYNALNSIRIEKRIGVIGEAIYKTAKENNLCVVQNYGGHGISISYEGKGIAHSSPFIFNKSNSNEGIRVFEGFCGAIEPLLVCGNSDKTNVSENGWNVNTINTSAHFEHSFYVKDNCVIITTLRENENYLKENKIYYENIIPR